MQAAPPSQRGRVGPLIPDQRKNQPNPMRLRPAALATHARCANTKSQVQQGVCPVSSCCHCMVVERSEVEMAVLQLATAAPTQNAEQPPLQQHEPLGEQTGFLSPTTPQRAETGSWANGGARTRGEPPRQRCRPRPPQCSGGPGRHGAELPALARVSRSLRRALNDPGAPHNGAPAGRRAAAGRGSLPRAPGMKAPPTRRLAALSRPGRLAARRLAERRQTEARRWAGPSPASFRPSRDATSHDTMTSYEAMTS